MMNYGDRSENEIARIQLIRLISEWNANRLDLFALSQPDENLEFHGVMRFYFQESGQKVATKCIRVSSTATTRAVIEALIEKFHPDMRMLSGSSYSLWEVHENGEERRLQPDEKPLLVQLNWHKDDREGRFLLRHDDLEPLPLKVTESSSQMKRKLSGKKKRELRKQGKELRRSKEAEDFSRSLYSEVPATTFTRTISNPEVVMRKRRERKLQQKLKEIGDGGSLKIYGEELSETRPYVTLLLSMRDRTDKILGDTLEKYGFDMNEQASFCLVEVENVPTSSGVPQYRETVLDDDDCPLMIIARGDPNCITFHVRRRQDTLPRYKSYGSVPGAVSRSEPLPYFLELDVDGKEQPGASRIFVIRPNVTEVGCDRALNSTTSQALCLFGPGVLPRHCVIAYMDNTTTITPCSRSAEVMVDENSIFDTTILKQGNLVRIGRNHLFQFYETGGETLADLQANAASNCGMMRSMSMPLGISPHVNTAKGDRSFASSSKSVAQSLDSAVSYGDTGVTKAVPAIIELSDEAEDEFLRAVIRDVSPVACSFKLTAAYVVYMCSFSRLSERYLTGISTTERKRRLRAFLHKVTGMIQVTVQDHCHDADPLAFWMANSSELLNFVKRDRQLSSCARPEPEESLADTVQKAFEHLVACFKQDLHSAMPPLLDPQLEDAAATDPCLQTLGEVLRLLGTYGVSAALNIQIFSQLFHYINMYLFNWLISRDGSAYCCRSWGRRLTRRLHFVLTWAEEQGLELAAECRLERILQTGFLLEALKTDDNMAAISERCTKLNSLQIRCLLERYHVDAQEPPMDGGFIERMAKAAELQVDEAPINEGQPLQVEENLELYLPLLLPEDGYSPEVIHGIPAGLTEFVETLSRKGLCKFMPQTTSNVSWQANFATDSSSPVSPARLNSSVAHFASRYGYG